MKWIGWFSVSSGVLMLSGLIFAPMYLIYTAPSYGVIVTGEMMLDMARVVWVSVLLEVLFALACLALGWMMLQKKVLGFTLWKYLCGFAIVSAIVSLFRMTNPLYDGFSLALWSVILVVTLFVFRAKRSKTIVHGV